MAKKKGRRKLYIKGPGRKAFYGRWISHLNAVAVSRGYVHTTGKYQGRTNIYRVMRELGYQNNANNRLRFHEHYYHGDVTTLGMFCQLFDCSPSDLIEWEPMSEEQFQLSRAVEKQPGLAEQESEEYALPS
jgi:DNA-binding Xre family transcriptional regulator